MLLGSQFGKGGTHVAVAPALCQGGGDLAGTRTGIPTAWHGNEADLRAKVSQRVPMESLSLQHDHIVEIFSSNPSDEVLVWQGRMPAGKWYCPPLNRHVVSLCLNDVAQARHCQAGQDWQGSLRAGQLMIVLAGQSGWYSNSDEADFLHMAIAPQRLQSVIVESGAHEGGVVSLRAGCALQDPALGALLSALHPGVHSGRPAPRSFIDSVARAICLHLAQCYRQAGPASGAEGLSDAEFSRVTETLRARMGTPVDMDHVAGELGISVAQLHRRFKLRTGQTLTRFWIELRLNWAHQMLTSTRQSVTEIALSTGFADLPHFSRHFRRQFGMTPSRLRCL